MERYVVRVAGHVSSRIATSLGCGSVRLAGADSVFEFVAVDPTALYGLISQLRDLGLELVAVERCTGASLQSAAKESSDDPS